MGVGNKEGVLGFGEGKELGFRVVVLRLGWNEDGPDWLWNRIVASHF